MPEIITETQLSKTTIFHHIKNISKSEQLLEKLHAINRLKLTALATQRRGKSVKSYPHWEPTEWSPGFVNLVAHFMFDGEIKSSSAIYNNRSQALINNVVSLMDEFIGTSDYIFYMDPSGVARVSYHHVEIAGFLRGKAKELLEYISTGTDVEKLAFLKAFYDDEGNVTFTGKHRCVRGYQHSVPRLELVQKLLTDFGIFSRLQEKFYEISISRKADIIRFRDVINFSPGVRINGLRSNSVWKESLEKREILERLIAAYQG